MNRLMGARNVATFCTNGFVNAIVKSWPCPNNVVDDDASAATFDDSK